MRVTNVLDKNNTFHFILFIALICFGLWMTNPSYAIKECEKVNIPKMCNVLNAE